jgi:hypothetical protein
MSSEGMGGDIFERQPLHWLLLALLVAVAAVLRTEAMAVGAFWGLVSTTWFWLSVASAVAHQVYVWFVWRVELHRRLISRLIGSKWGFRIYAFDFALLMTARIITIIGLAAANRDTLAWPVAVIYILAAALLVPFIYLQYSVLRYFGMRRAAGLDHFDPAMRHEPLVREGIFAYIPNAMYTVGFFGLYLPGLLLQSQAALLAAAFQHAYIWVHYYCTELPDMRHIYGEDELRERY